MRALPDSIAGARQLRQARQETAWRSPHAASADSEAIEDGSGTRAIVRPSMAKLALESTSYKRLMRPTNVDLSTPPKCSAGRNRDDSFRIRRLLSATGGGDRPPAGNETRHAK